MTQNEEKKQYKFFQTPKVLKKLDPYEWVLFTVLFDEWQMMKNEEGWFFRSEDDLSEDTGLSTATIYRKTKSLEEKGFILVKRHSDGKTKSERYKSNDYKINIETIISLAPIKSHHRENESHQKDEPTNNIPTNKQYSTMDSTMKTFEDRTPNDETLQDDEVENVYLNNYDDDWLNYEVKRSMMGEVINDLKLIDIKKENERSDNGTTAMNDNEQGRSNASESDTINEMTTSTSGGENITSRDDVDNSKVENEKNDTPKGLIPIPPNSAQPPFPLNKAAGERQNTSVDNLSTQGKKTRQNARKEEIRRFNKRHDKNRYDMCHNIKSSADFDRVNAELQKDIEYVNGCDWSEDRKELWHSNYDLWISKCEPIIMKHLNKVMEMEKTFG